MFGLRVALLAIAVAISTESSVAAFESEITKLSPFAVNGRPLRMPYDGVEVVETVARLTEGFSHFRFGGLAILNSANRVDNRFRLLLWEKNGPRTAPADRIVFSEQGFVVSAAIEEFFVTSSGADSDSAVCVFQENEFRNPVISDRDLVALWDEYREYVSRLKRHIEVLYGIRDFDKERACASVLEWLLADEIVLVFRSEAAASSAAERTSLRREADKLHIGEADLRQGIKRMEIDRRDILTVVLWKSGTPCVVSANGRGIARISNFGYRRNRLSKPKLNAVIPVFRPFGQAVTYSKMSK